MKNNDITAETVYRLLEPHIDVRLNRAKDRIIISGCATSTSDRYHSINYTVSIPACQLFRRASDEGAYCWWSIRNSIERFVRGYMPVPYDGLRVLKFKRNATF